MGGDIPGTLDRSMGGGEEAQVAPKYLDLCHLWNAHI